jgi:hypothetical protein
LVLVAEGGGYILRYAEERHSASVGQVLEGACMSEMKDPANDALNWGILIKEGEVWIHFPEENSLVNLGDKEAVFAKWVEIMGADDYGERPESAKSVPRRRVYAIAAAVSEVIDQDVRNLIGIHASGISASMNSSLDYTGVRTVEAVLAELGIEIEMEER